MKLNLPFSHDFVSFGEFCICRFMCRPPKVKLAQKIRILEYFLGKNLGQFRTLLRPSNFEMGDFSYKANSFPYANI